MSAALDQTDGPSGTRGLCVPTMMLMDWRLSTNPTLSLLAAECRQEIFVRECRLVLGGDDLISLGQIDVGGLLMITCFPAAMPSIPPRCGPRRRTDDDYVDIGCSQRLGQRGERLSATLGAIFSLP
jgi:hypothetical protein